MFNSSEKDDLEAAVASLLHKAKEKGATQAAVSASLSRGFSVDLRKGAVDNLEFNRDKGITFLVYSGQRQGVATSSDLSAAALDRCVEKAWYIAKHTDEDPFAGLAPADRMASQMPDLDLYHPWDITPEQAIVLLQEAEAAGMQSDPRIQNSEGVSLNTHAAIGVYGNSHGFLGHTQQTSHSFSCVLLAAEADGKMQRDYDYTCSRRADELENFSLIAKNAAQYAVQRLGSRAIPTGKMPILLSERIAGQIWGKLVAAISGSNLYRDASFLKNSVGQKILNVCVNITENPSIPGGWGSCSFDNEGVTAVKRELVQQGVLNGYLLNSYSARHLGLESTGNAGGAHNLLVHSTGESASELLQKMDRGLLVTELMGMGVNLVTGDFSQGASGFFVEQGQVQYPVEGVTIAGNLKDMFAHIIAIGSDVNRRSYIQSGSILISEMTVAGSD